MVFDITLSKIEDSLLSMGWTKAMINFVTQELGDEDGVVDDGELLYVADSLETLVKDLRKIYEYPRDNNLDFAEFEKMAHLLLD